MKSENIDLLAKALSLAQGSLKGAKKDAENPFYHSKYADLESVWEAARDALTKNGLSVSQTTDTADGKLILLTWLFHSSGQWLCSKTPVIQAKQDAQGMGAAITYARRFAFAAIVGVVQTDDDGETAVGRTTTTAKPYKMTKTKQELAEEQMAHTYPDDLPKTFPPVEKKTSPQTELPGINTTNQGPGDYIIEWHELKGHKLSDYTDEQLQKYLTRIKDIRNKQRLDPPENEFGIKVTAYLKARGIQ